MDIGVILAEARVTFHHPVLFGTPIKIGVHTEKLGNKSLTVEQVILNADSDEMLASGQVILVTYNYHNKQTIPIPDSWREKISQYEKRV